MSSAPGRPIVLGANQLHRFYRGGARIAALRGTVNEDEYAPEDWVGSTTPVWGSDSVGLTALDDGRALRDAIAADAERFLGPEHVRVFGPDAAVLVKLLDAGERLPVHLHPDRSFAREHLGSRYGKTEAWVIADAAPGAGVHVAFKEDVGIGRLASWVMTQDTSALLGALHRVPVSKGDTLFIPAGVPHAIGEGVFIVEVQEPSDLSILLEWDGFEIDGRAEGHLGLGFDLALHAVDRSGWSESDLERLRAPRPEARRRPGVEALLPLEADAFFRVERIRSAPARLPAAFSILIAIEGAGTLASEVGDHVDLGRGATVLLPWAAGECVVRGAVQALRCMPPRVDAVSA